MRSIPDYDVIVIGAGPAGSNFARMLKSDARVLLLCGSKPSGKVCAGLLSPDAQDLFAKYDLTLPSSILASPQLFRVRTIDLHTDLSRDYRRSYLNLDRAGFDAYLRSLLPSSIQIRKGFCLSVESQGGLFRLRIKTAEGFESLTCRMVVGADGASGVVRRDLFPTHRLPRYTAIQQWYEASGTDPFYSCIFDSTTSDSCSWIFFKDHTLIFGGAFRSEGCRKAFEAQKAQLIARGLIPTDSAKRTIRTEACCVAMPTASSHIFLGEDGAFLLGEAAGLISPSSLEGISYALASGEALACAANEIGLSDHRALLHAYRTKVASLVCKVGLRCIKRSILCSEPLRTAILRSGVCSLPEGSRMVQKATDSAVFR